MGPVRPGDFFPNSGSYRVLVGSFDRYLRIPLQLVPGRRSPGGNRLRTKIVGYAFYILFYCVRMVFTAFFEGAR